MAEVPAPSAWQVRRARAITAWYLRRYHGTPADPGTGLMFCQPEHVGHFAVSKERFCAGDPAALFRVLVATAMFQRLRDVLIKKILLRLSADEVAELTTPGALLAHADGCGCEHARTLEGLISRCDLAKDTSTKLGICERAPAIRCAPKRHTVQLRRYGHFGKMPTSLALALREQDASDLSVLRERALRDASDPLDAARRLEASLTRAWRVSDKISAMFLSMLTNPDLCPGLAPWTSGVDWTYFVVIDSNVDLFLRETGYPGPWTYAARREFLQALSRRVDVASMKPGLSAYNPRVVQQALFLFMSASNRRAGAQDCMHEGAEVCRACPVSLRTLCSVKDI